MFFRIPIEPGKRQSGCLGVRYGQEVHLLAKP